jgi:hypothetical protein
MMIQGGGMAYKHILVVTGMILLCVGCASTPMTSQPATVNGPETMQRLEGAPLPLGAVVDNKKSIIFGEGPLWTGRVEVHTALNAEEVIRFFINQYPTAGWTFLSSTKSNTSVLIFVGQNKTLIAEIKDKSFGTGANIILTVSPANQN